MATTSFVDEVLALHSKLQKHIEIASPAASKTQVNWELIWKVAGHLLATSQLTDIMNLDTLTLPLN